MEGSSQAGFALVAAAFVTGIWTWVAQRAKTKDENEKQEINIDIQDRQNLLQEYRQSNKQFQDQIVILNGQISNLWEVIDKMQKALESCERSRIDDIRRIVELERSLSTHILRSVNDGTG